MTEVRLTDQNGQPAGNVDFVLVSYDEHGRLLDFGSLEVQAVYVSGNLRNVFSAYMSNPDTSFSWSKKDGVPRPDYLSSSRKRLLPQMTYKGGIFHAWGKKQAVALQHAFFKTLPELPTATRETAEVAWLLYDLLPDEGNQTLHLRLVETVYTQFLPALQRISWPKPGDIDNFVSLLQSRLDETLDSSPPDAPALSDLIGL